MNVTGQFRINGAELLVPDENVEMTFTDIECGDSDYDESGFYHRMVQRHRVGSWRFSFSRLSQEEYAYLVRILPQSGVFTFTYPAPDDCTQTLTTPAYLSGHTVALKSLKDKTFRELKFTVNEC